MIDLKPITIEFELMKKKMLIVKFKTFQMIIVKLKKMKIK